MVGAASPRFLCVLSSIPDKKRMETSQPPRFLGPPPRSLYLTPVDHNRERVGSDTGSALFWPTEARRLRTSHSGACS